MDELIAQIMREERRVWPEASAIQVARQECYAWGDADGVSPGWIIKAWWMPDAVSQPWKWEFRDEEAETLPALLTLLQALKGAT